MANEPEINKITTKLYLFLFQCPIESPIENLPVNTALVLLVDHTADLEKLRPTSNGSEEIKHYIQCIKQLESLGTIHIFCKHLYSTKLDLTTYLSFHIN